MSFLCKHTRLFVQKNSRHQKINLKFKIKILQFKIKILQFTVFKTDLKNSLQTFF